MNITSHYPCESYEKINKNQSFIIFRNYCFVGHSVYLLENVYTEFRVCII